MPRANTAPSIEQPQGSPERVQSNDQSVIQQHVDYFDLNGDGIITMLETYRSFRRLRYNIMSSFAAMLVINLSFSYFTLDTWIPDPTFNIYVKNIHAGKHGSDSGMIKVTIQLSITASSY